jgi:hypothetical protein
MKPLTPSEFGDPRLLVDTEFLAKALCIGVRRIYQLAEESIIFRELDDKDNPLPDTWSLAECCRDYLLYKIDSQKWSRMM